MLEFGVLDLSINETDDLMPAFRLDELGTDYLTIDILEAVQNEVDQSRG